MRYEGRGQLILENNETVEVEYWMAEFPSRGTRTGRINHASGHPNWHPMMSLEPGPHTLVLQDGRRIKVIFTNLDGAFTASGDFF